MKYIISEKFGDCCVYVCVIRVRMGGGEKREGMRETDTETERKCEN